MLIERTNATEPASSLNNLNTGGRFKETFQDILNRTLNNKSNSRPPKIELTGILIPCFQEIRGQVYRFKLGTDSNEYFLSMNTGLTQVAKNAAWEEVTVKGYLNLDTQVFDVEKIVLTEADEPYQVPAGMRETYFDLDAYEKIIHQRGKLEPAFDYLAS
jgi:hypothetical protein